MTYLKAAAVIVFAAAMALWFGSTGALPLPDPAESFAIGVVGLVAMAIGAVLRAFALVLVPLVLVGRVLLLPALVGAVLWFLWRRRAR